MRINRLNKWSIRGALVLAALATSPPTWGAVRTYIGPDGGNWGTPGNWTASAVPVNGDDAWIQTTAGDRNVILDVSYLPPGLGSLTLDGQNFSTATLTQNSGNMIVSGATGGEWVGVGNNSRGRYVQSGGTHTVNTGLLLAVQPGSSGFYELSGAGTLNVNANANSSTYVANGGTGNFIQTGGTHNVSRLYVGAVSQGSSGSYLISGGTVNAGIVFIGGPASGYFQQTGGNVGVNIMEIGLGGAYNLSAGSLSANGFTNNSTFTQSQGHFTGSIANNGSWSHGGGGMTITTGGMINNNTMTLSGGFLNLNGTATNNGLIQSYSNVSIGGPSPLNNLGLLSQGPGTLTFSTPLNNSGNINLAPAGALGFTNTTLTNTGTINLANGRISGTGTGTLVNRFGGTITGAGLISSLFDNQGGRLLLTSGTTLITNAFNNSGIIQLANDAASLGGGAITNSGEVAGHGSIANQISNIGGGMIEARGGTLILGGVVNNGAGGILSAPAGGKLFHPGGLTTNGGLINLSGGAFDNNISPINNTGQISGFGTIRTGGLANNGSVTLTGGFTTVVGPVTNSATRQIKIAYDPALFTGNVINNGIFKTTDTTVTFSGTYTENGTFISDPSDNYFMDVTFGGTWTGGVGDRFFVKGVLDWIGGSMTGSGGATFNQGSAAIHDAPEKTLSGWTFNNEKPLTLAGGNLNMGNAAVINNTSTFDFVSDANITKTLPGAATFLNTATLRKSGGSGVSNVAALVSINNGTIDVQTGTLTLQGGLDISPGTTLPKNGAGQLVILGPQSHGVGAQMTANSGRIHMISNAGTPATAGAAAVARLTLNVSGNNSLVTLGGNQEIKELNVPFANAGNQTFDLNTPPAAGAFNLIRVYAADLTAAKATLWSAVKNTNGPGSLTPLDGIIDTGKAAHAGSGIGLARINDLHGDPHIAIRLAKIGDLNLDGTVSISDFIDLAANFNSSGPSITWQEGDLNYDGSVTISDFIDLAANFNSNYSADRETVADFASSIGVDASIIGAAVPEPGTALGIVGAAMVLCKRRRKLAHSLKN